jgi:mannose-6-phosphate isomerase-like protein (cupin superfamily)
MVLPAPARVREYQQVDGTLFASIRASRQPAVLRGLAKDWPAVRAATTSDEALLDYLQPFMNEQQVSALVGQPEIEGRFFYKDDLSGLNFQHVRAAVPQILARLLRDRCEPRPFSMAIQSEAIPGLLPGFELQNSVSLLTPDIVPRAWIGNRVSVATHYDLQENIGVVVAGRRRFTLFPPDQIANLYPGPFELTPGGTPVSMVDPGNPDLGRYPNYAEAAASAQQVELEPGDAIYIPYHWWHAVDSLAPFNFFTNYWWSDAPKEGGHPYHALMYAFYAIRPLPSEQRDVWRAAFDYYIFERSGDPAAHLPPHAQGVLTRPNRQQFGRLRETLKQFLLKL